MNKLLITLALPILLWGTPVAGDQQLVSVKVDKAPTIDGKGNDPVWAQVKSVTTRDPIVDIDITLKSVYTDDEVFMLVQYPDRTENRAHKTMMWDQAAERYRTGPQREDTFVFKWSMELSTVDLSVSADKPYKADIWFWKAHRTDHAAYADDKMQIYSITAMPRSRKLVSRGGRRFYLRRMGDEGSAAYRPMIVDGHTRPEVAKYDFQQPSGSRADVRAKGVWRNGVWTVEFRRKLNTGNIDDVQFDKSGSYRFGVSRYEIAGRPKDPRLEQPYYGAGDIGEHLTLVFR